MRVSAAASVAGIATMTVCAGTSLAQPAIDSAVINLRIFNDDPTTTLTSVNNYATEITISDSKVGNNAGFANLHNWRASADGGATAADFANGDSYSLFSDVTISGTGDGEAGLNLSPWWSPDVDGRFNLRTTDGEVAIFGGRLPFYSFTGSQGVTYVKGSMVRIGMIYDANSNSAGDPATIEYLYDDGTAYTSGPLAFDQGNPAEGFGEWGMLDSAQIGGYMQFFVAGDNTDGLSTTWGNISYIPAPGSLALLGLGALGAVRRRR